ncbi:MAG: FAD-dependent oxidoreductase [Nevskia sp.]|jgi:monoamine oxidase|nr:FAD-dependent oxidoreductase [Nevskia sp.]
MANMTRRDVLRVLAYAGGRAALMGGLAAFGWLRTPPAVADELPRFSGLPSAGKRVAIIGAGVAGLTSAFEMSKAGFDVTIYEAEKRYGGRSLTVRPSDPAYRTAYLDKKVVPSSFVTEASYVSEFAEVGGETQHGRFVVRDPANPAAPFIDLYLNAGPGRLPLHHTGVLDYCRRFGVKLEPYIFRTEANLLRSAGLNGGAPVQIRQYGNNLRGYLAEILADSTNALGARADAPLKAEELKVFREMLRAYGDLTQTSGGKFIYLNPNVPGLYSRPGYVVEPYAGPYDGVTPQILSFEEIVNSKLWNQLVGDTQLYWQSSLLQPVGGMDMIWQAFLAQRVGPSGQPLRDRVRLNSTVRAINSVADGSKVQVSLANGTSEYYDYVISTASPKVMTGFKGSTAIRPEVMAALRQVRYEFGGKYGWQGRSRFWEQNDTQIFGGISWIDTVTEQMWYPSSGYNDWSGVLTGGYIHNQVAVDLDGKPIVPVDPILQNATRWGAMPQAKRREAALQSGELLHPGFSKKVFADDGISIAWQNMPQQYGITALFDFSEQLPLYNALLKPADDNGRVLFAGDWLSFWAGWQEGSVRSAWYAMSQIATHLATQPKTAAPTRSAG